MSTKKIFISDQVAEICIDILKSRGLQVQYSPGVAPTELCQMIESFDGLVVRSATKVTADVIAHGKNLRVIGRAGVGVDNIDIPTATNKGIAVLNAASANTVSVVEYTFSLMLALSREIPRAHMSLTNGQWEKSSFMGVELFQKTLGLIGLGKIGREVAKRAKAFGMQILAYDPFIESDSFIAAGVEESDLQNLLRQSDFISIHVPVTKYTKYLIGEESLKICKSNSRIINTARGGIIDERALYQALKNGTIAGAALDVYEKEPPGENPLLGLDNVIATPHLAATTVEALQRVAEVTAHSVANFLHHNSIENIVNPEVIQKQ